MSWRELFPKRGGNHERLGLLRVPVDAIVTVNTGTGGIEATALDVSERGMKIETAEELPVGPVAVKLVGMPTFSGEIRWQQAGKAGVQLQNPIPRTYLGTWLETHGWRRPRD